jgi:hypothetical protein
LAPITVISALCVVVVIAVIAQFINGRHGNWDMLNHIVGEISILAEIICVVPCAPIT